MDHFSNEVKEKSPKVAGFKKWFWRGFFLVFLVLAFGWKVSSMHPSGQFAVLSPLWQFYLVNLNSLFSANQSLGPASGSSGQFIELLMTHLACSCIAGVIAALIGKKLRKP